MLIEIASNRWEKYPPGQGRLQYTFYGAPHGQYDPWKSWPALTIHLSVTDRIRGFTQGLPRSRNNRHLFNPWTRRPR